MYTLDAATLKASRALADRDQRAGHHPPRRDRGRSRRPRRSSTRRRRRVISSRSASGARGRSPRTACWLTPPTSQILAKRERRRVAQSREQHEAGQRHRAGAGAAARPASPSGSAPTAPPATTTSTCSRRCARRRSCTSSRSKRPARAAGAATSLGDGDASTARARSAWTDQIGSLEPGKRADLIVVVDGVARGRRRCTIRSRTSSTSRAATTCGRRS